MSTNFQVFLVKTDSIFYRLFKDFPEAFFDLLEVPDEETENYEFTSREVKQLSFRLDGLFWPNSNQADKPFYVVEVQFQPDQELYYRIFGELFLLLRQYQPLNPWKIVVIYPNRGVEREQSVHFAGILSLDSVYRVYLDELGNKADNSLGIRLLQLIIEDESSVGAKARELVRRGGEGLTDESVRRNWVDLIETILVYKLPHKSREEIEAMFGLSELKQTKVYQEAQLEAKLEAIPRMLDYGLTLEAIAQLLDLPLDEVQEESQKYTQKPENG